MSGQRLRWHMRGMNEDMDRTRFDLLTQLYKKIPKHTRVCFIAGVITGWLTHFYMLTGKFLNWDDANNMDTYGSGDYLGRWF